MLADYKINCRHVEIIRRDFTHFIENIDSKNTEFLDLLYNKKVIEFDEKQDLEEIGSSQRRNERLLSMLNRKSFEQFQQFLDALELNGQKHVVSNYTGSFYCLSLTK